MMRSENWKWMIGVAALGAIAGCTVGPRYRAPAPPTVTAYTPQPLRQRRPAAKAPQATHSASIRQRQFHRTGGRRSNHPN